MESGGARESASMRSRRSGPPPPPPTRDPRFDDINDLQRRVPWKSIFFAMFLLTIGVFLLVLSHFASKGKLGYAKGPKANEQAIGLAILGFLTFLPGFHETRIAYYAFRGYRNYSFAQIPNFDG